MAVEPHQATAGEQQEREHQAAAQLHRGMRPEGKQQHRQGEHQALAERPPPGARAEEGGTGRSRRLPHQTRCGGQGLEHHRAGGIDHQVQQGDMHRQQDQRLAGQQQRQGAEGRDRQMDRQGVGKRAVQVGVHAAPQGDRLHQIGEAVVEQHQIS